MKFYHIDRSGSLSTGMVIRNTFAAPVGMNQELFDKLFPSGVSRWGLATLTNAYDTFSLLTTREFREPFISWVSLKHAEFNTVYAEIMLELMRASHFSTLPSRLSSFFAACGTYGLSLWEEQFKNENYRIFEVEPSQQPVLLDAHYLPGGMFYAEQPGNNVKIGTYPTSILSAINSYWDSGCMCVSECNQHNPLEALLLPPVVIGQQIPRSALADNS